MCRACASDDPTLPRKNAELSGSHDTLMPNTGERGLDVAYPYGRIDSVAGLRGAWAWQERVRLLGLRSRVLEESLQRRGASAETVPFVQLNEEIYTDLPIVGQPDALQHFAEGTL